MITTNRAILTFYTNAGSIVRLSIPRADLSKTAAAARASMEAMIDTEAVITSNGVPRTVRGAELVQTERVIMV